VIVAVLTIASEIVMTTPVWRPERRNRKIGTEFAGFKAVNKMGIPVSWLDRDGVARLYSHRLNPELIETFGVLGGNCTILYEKPKEGFSYGCSPQDVLQMLSMVPPADREGLKAIAFRQPTAKQSLLNPVWGRLLYRADFRHYQGAAIVLEALEVSRALKWDRRLDVEHQLELERLRRDGHMIESTKREHVIRMTEASIRNTILYRTLLHEIGHWVNWLEDTVRPETALAVEPEDAEDLYFAKPRTELEAFAHRYADELAARLKASHFIPFSPKATAAPSMR
jgi:hypothetical protein